MRKLYIIQTYNIVRPEEYGFMMNPILKTEPQIMTFPSRRAARKYLKENGKKLRFGWVHIIHRVYVQAGREVSHD